MVAILAAVSVVDVTFFANSPNVVADLCADVSTKDEVSGNFAITIGVVNDASGPKGVASARSTASIAALKSLWGHPSFTWVRGATA